METTYDLKPLNSTVKSFYGKATVEHIDYANKTLCVLKSYNTDVIALVYDGTGYAQLFRLWNGYSATTMRHINEFLAQHGILQGGKKWFASLPCKALDDAIEYAKWE